MGKGIINQRLLIGDLLTRGLSQRLLTGDDMNYFSNTCYKKGPRKWALYVASKVPIVGLPFTPILAPRLGAMGYVIRVVANLNWLNRYHITTRNLDK